MPRYHPTTADGTADGQTNERAQHPAIGADDTGRCNRAVSGGERKHHPSGFVRVRLACLRGVRPKSLSNATLPLKVGVGREAVWAEAAVLQVVVVLNNKNPPTPCLWQAPASTQKTKRKTGPAIRRSARWRVVPEDTREHHIQYNRQTTTLHSHRPLARGCRRGTQLHCNVV